MRSSSEALRPWSSLMRCFWLSLSQEVNDMKMVAELAFFIFFPAMIFVSLFFSMSTDPSRQCAVDKVVTLQSLLSPPSQNPANGAFQCNFITNLQRANAFVTPFLQPDFAAQVQRHEKQMENNYRGLWHWSQFYFLKIGLNIMFVMSRVQFGSA